MRAFARAVTCPTVCARIYRGLGSTRDIWQYGMWYRLLVEVIPMLRAFGCSGVWFPTSLCQVMPSDETEAWFLCFLSRPSTSGSRCSGVNYSSGHYVRPHPYPQRLHVPVGLHPAKPPRAKPPRQPQNPGYKPAARSGDGLSFMGDILLS